MPSQEAIYRGVCARLVEALNVDQEKITPPATMFRTVVPPPSDEMMPEGAAPGQSADAPSSPPPSARSAILIESRTIFD